MSGPTPRRAAAELVVIVAGVLIALGGTRRIPGPGMIAYQSRERKR